MPNPKPRMPRKSSRSIPKQINGIRIVKTGSDPIELAKLADTWEIAKPSMLHADQDAVDMLTNSLATLNADRLIDDHPADLNAFGLATPPIEVDVTLKDGKTRKLLLGGDTPAATGTYAKLESDPKVYTVPTSTKTSFDKTVNDLRDKRLLTFNQDKLTSVTLAGNGPAIEFGKNAQGDWQITKPKPMRADTLLVDDLVRKLKDAKMDLASTDAAEQFAKGEKVGTASTTDNLGTQTLELHKAKDNSYYAKSSALAGTVTKSPATWATASPKASTISAIRNCSISASMIPRRSKSTARLTRSRATNGCRARLNMTLAVYRP